MRPLLLLVLALALALALLRCGSPHAHGVHAMQSSRYESTLSFLVEPRAETCFFEDLSAGQVFGLEFEVVRGGLLDIRLVVRDPTLTVVLDRMAFFNHPNDAENEAEGRVSITAMYNGPYKFCFDNTMSRWTAKTVSFFVAQDAQQAKPAYDDRAKLEHLGPIVDSVIKIADDLDAIENVQHHMRVREQVDRDSSETTDSMLAWLSLAESIAMIALTIGQYYYIMSWFKETAKVARV